MLKKPKKFLTTVCFLLVGLLAAGLSHAKETRLSADEQEWAALNAAVVQAYRDGQYQRGVSVAETAYRFALEHLGKPHPLTLTSINNLAILYVRQGRYGEAEPLYKEALQLSEKVLGREHPDTLISINNLAGLYSKQGRYGEAEPLYKEALQIREKVLGREHPDTLTVLMNAIALSINTGNTRKAFIGLNTMDIRLQGRAFQELYNTASDRVRRLYLTKISNFQDVTFSFARLHPTPAHQRFAAQVLLRWKQVYAEESAFQHRLLTISHDPRDIQLKNRIGALRSKFSLKFRQDKGNTDVLETWQELNQAEMDIRSRAKVFKTNLQVANADLNAVQAQLPRDGALIEYRIYSPLNLKTGKPDPPHLAAYLLLGDIDGDQQLFFEDLGGLRTIFEALAVKAGKPTAIYQSLCGKFDEKIKNLNKIYIAPDGFLHLISFAALRLSDGKYLTQRQQINRLQTGRDLIKASYPTPANQILAFGGVDYGKAAATVSASIENLPQHYIARAARELKAGIAPLPNSLYEAQAIASIFKTNCKGGGCKIYTGDEASEGRLKRLTQAPRIVHFSTHGFFLENTTLLNWAEEESPLLLSGLALAGANNGLKGQVDENGDDGLLYSIEVLGLNLQGTELVSLSACDTGKGVVDYSEGVYGLVRAFRTAGARSVLMTLRPVGDRSSRDFMETFYNNWLGSKDSPLPAVALHRTRLEFINHPNKKYRDPAIWSPYVMVGL